MKLENIYIFVEAEIKNQFGTKAKMGKACGKTRQEVNKVLTKLKTNSGITYKKERLIIFPFISKFFYKLKNRFSLFFTIFF